MSNIIFRDANEQDLPFLLELESNFKAPWKKENLMYELTSNPVSRIVVAEQDLKVIGFIDYWITFDSATIAQIAVDPVFRKKGIATELFNRMLQECEKEKVVYITLEVRSHNVSAIKFYEKLGFKNILLKPRYYENGDDAFYMIMGVEQNG